MAVPLDDLDELMSWCWAQLSRATQDRHSEYRWLNLATIDAKQIPQVRTVVLRNVDQSSHRISFHTDKRSNKLLELSLHSTVALHCHSRHHAVQLRMMGTASVASEKERQAAWQRLHKGAKGTYLQVKSPGAEIESATDNPFGVPSSSNDGYANFSVIDVSISSLDCLRLDGAGHRRALFTYTTCGQHQSTWLAP